MREVNITGGGGQLSPAALAFVGDGVFELLVRERLVARGSLPAHLLHKRAVARVNAVAQAAAYPAVEAELNAEELAILKRGRNAGGARVPKSCAPEDYRKATGIEALFGWLYLAGQTARLERLYAVMEKVWEEKGD